MGKFKLLLIFIGGFVLLRFIGQLLRAKRDVAAQNKMKFEQDNLRKEKEYIAKNEGKIKVFGKNQQPTSPFEDVDYEEVKK